MRPQPFISHGKKKNQLGRLKMETSETLMQTSHCNGDMEKKIQNNCFKRNWEWLPPAGLGAGHRVSSWVCCSKVIVYSIVHTLSLICLTQSPPQNWTTIHPYYPGKKRGPKTQNLRSQQRPLPSFTAHIPYRFGWRSLAHCFSFELVLWGGRSGFFLKVFLRSCWLQDISLSVI